MDINKYLHSLSTHTLKAGSLIFSEGDSSDGTMYFLIHGAIEIYTDYSGKRIKVNEIKEGGFFGEIALIKNINRTATAVVASPEAQLAYLDRSIFVQVARQNPEFLFEVLKTVIDRLIIAEIKIRKLTNN